MSWFPRQNLIYIILRSIKIAQHIAYRGPLVPRLHEIRVKRDQGIKSLFGLWIARRIHLAHPDLHQLLLFRIGCRPRPTGPDLCDKTRRDRAALTL